MHRNSSYGRANSSPHADGDAGEEGAGSQHRDDFDEPSPGFLGRVNSYRQLMHAHTKAQLDSSGTGTIPTYTKTMHAHTLTQLHEYRRTSRSEASTPLPASRHAMVPAKIFHALSKLSIGEAAQAPVNTPEHIALSHEPLLGIDFGKLRRRSLTTPYAARDFAVVESRDVMDRPITTKVS